MKRLKAYNVQIWCGLKEHHDGKVHTIVEVHALVDRFVNEYKGCVSITPTEFRYVDGYEPGVILGMLQYPKFKRTENEITGRAIILAKWVSDEFNQLKVTITTPNESIMFEKLEF